jgi:MFS family permease
LSTILAILSLTGQLTLAALFVCVLLLGMVNMFDGPTRLNFVTSLVGPERLANAIALNSISMNVARLFGPTAAGALIAWLGVTPCFFVNACSFGAVILSLVAMRSSELIPQQREARAKGQIRAGLRYIRSTRSLYAPLVMVLVTGMLTWEFPVTLPLLTTSTFHADATVFGILMSCLGAGSIVGAIVAARRRHLSVRSLSLSAIIWGVLVTGQSVAPTLPALYAVTVLVGVGTVTFNSASKTLLQLASVPQMRGRVMATWSMLWLGSSVVGAPIVGFAASAFGARYGLLVGGVGAILVGAAVLLTGRNRSDAHMWVCQVNG